MKPNGYVKLHRALLDNPIFFKDRTATYLFIALLMLVDRHTGVYNGGRFKLSATTGIKPITCYKTLKRLQKETMVKLEVNRDYTKITVVNWKKYQGEETLSKRPVNPKETQSNTKQEVISKNKENRTTSYGKPEINELFNYWSEKTGIPLTSQVQNNRRACNNLIKQHGKDGVRRLIDGVVIAQADKYAPRIANFSQLQSKLPDLLLWGKKQTNKGVVKV